MWIDLLFLAGGLAGFALVAAAVTGAERVWGGDDLRYRPRPRLRALRLRLPDGGPAAPRALL